MSSPQELPQQAANYLFISSNKEAKRVIDTKVQNGKRYYKVKWESSWEAEDSVGEYQDLVDQFWNFVKRVSSDDGAEDLQKKSALSEEDGQEESTIPNSEDETPSKGAITLSDCVKLQESGNFYRLTQVNKESDDERPIFIVQGNQPQMKRKKGNVHVIGLQHEPKQAKKQRTDDPSLPPVPVTQKPPAVEPLANLVVKDYPAVEPLANLVVKDYPVTVPPTNRVSKDSSNSEPDKKRQAQADPNSDDTDVNATTTDKIFGWDNPYVCISFFCRICKDEQIFDEDEWRTHFNSHLVNRQPLDERPAKTNNFEVCYKICSDPKIPWIQKVDCLIQNYGVNQYVRLVFLCRICRKEQKSTVTGNWRNHFQVTHSANDPLKCDLCGVPVKSKHALNEHKKIHHKPASKEKEKSIHSCDICSMPFQRKNELKKHVSQSHTQSNVSMALEQPTLQKTFDPSTKVAASVKKPHQNPFIDTTFTEPAKPSKKKTKNTSASNTNGRFTCGMCHRSFKTKIEMNSHQEEQHFFNVHSSAKQIYQCPKCEEVFAKHINLLNHTIEKHGIQDTLPGAITVADLPKENPNENKTKSSSEKRKSTPKKLAPTELEASSSNTSDVSATSETLQLQPDLVKIMNKQRSEQIEGSGFQDEESDQEEDGSNLIVIIKEEETFDDPDESFVVNVPLEERPPWTP
ncbi:uncharacterized protein [Clytia hemisphaerica]|uniref:uncharacterized protein n=1 Tax=Clytia hemisphaerica TaxID=252671 RepID=UPI0034D6C5CC